jgi:hypothetical protein
MEAEAQPVCMFHQYGHCKFGSSCRHFHTQNTCTNTQCSQNACSARHPKPCRFLLRNNFCKFGGGCSYLHPIPAPSFKELNEEILSVKDNLDLLITSLNIKEIQIMKLEEKVKELEKIVSAQSITSLENFKCDFCDFCCDSEKAPKSHKSKKHKREALRDNLIPETTLHLSPLHSVDERAEALYSPPQPEDEDQHQIPKVLQFKCDMCGHESGSLAALQGHKSIKHDFFIPHTAKWDKNKCHICNISFKDTALFKSHMIVNHGFLDDSKECMNCESLEVVLYLPVPQQYIFMNCKDCEHEEEEEDD